MKNIFAILLLSLIASESFGFEIWINEKLWSPLGNCMIHAKTPVSPPSVNCVDDNVTIEIILDSSYKNMEWIQNNLPLLRAEAKEEGAYSVYKKAEYFEVKTLNKKTNKLHHSRFIMSEFVFVHADSGSYKDLVKATSKVWE